MLALRLAPVRRVVHASILAGASAAIAYSWNPTPAGAATKPPGFQIQAELLGYSPVGSIGNGENLSDRFGSGPGFSVAASSGITRKLIIGVRASHMRGHEDGTFQFDDHGGLPIDTQPPPSGPYDVRRSLWTTPVHGFAQYRQPAGRLVAYGELGAGVTSFIERDKASSGGQYMFDISGYQQNFSMGASGGVGVPAGLFEVTAEVSYIQAFTTDGDVWASGDNPKFVTFGIGLRYPRF